jgi:hypothetical protein
MTTITIKSKSFAEKGKLSFIFTEGRAGTAVYSIIIASSLREISPSGIDTLDIQTEYCAGKEVIYIDTDNPTQFSRRMAEHISIYMDSKHIPANFHLFNLRKYNNFRKLDFIKGFFNRLPKAHLWIINEVSDLFNDISDARDTIKWFEATAQHYNTTIILIAGENSELAYSQVFEDELLSNYSAVSICKNRVENHHEIIFGDSIISFRYDKNLKRMVTKTSR